MMAFVEKVASAQTKSLLQMSRRSVSRLPGRGHLRSAATAAARCFFSKLLDALGVQADSTFNDLDPTLREALTVGRRLPIGQNEARPDYRARPSSVRPRGAIAGASMP